MRRALLLPIRGRRHGSGRVLLAPCDGGGPGHVVPLGLLLAGMAVTAGLTGRLPRWTMVFGLVVAAIAELSVLALVFPAAAWLLPLARFPALVWLICAGVLLPKTIGGS